MKYKLINTKTKEETICDKVTIDGIDYYVSDEKLQIGDYYIAWETISNIESNYIIQKANDFEPLGMYSWADNYKKVIATNNPNIDIPNVVDEVEELAKQLIHSEGIEVEIVRTVWINGYNKSQETHPFSENDVKEIFKIAQMQKNYGDYKPYTFEESIQLWKEQKPKIVYYE